MWQKICSIYSQGNFSEIEFEKLLRRAEQSAKGARLTLLKKDPLAKRLANS